MGLDISHNAFHGSYSAFNRLRQAICYVIGGSYPPHMESNYLLWSSDNPPDKNTWYWGQGYSEETHPGLFLFLCHSDCDGEISPEDCLKVVKDLEPIIPRLEELGLDWGNIQKNGGFAGTCRKFIDGCKLAAQSKEPLYFY
jgi:hypothetical protein